MSEERPPIHETPFRDRLRVPVQGEVYNWTPIHAMRGEKTLDSLNEEQLRQLVREEVHNALHPEPGIYDVAHFLIVEARDETGKRWKGVLYAIDEEKE